MLAKKLALNAGISLATSLPNLLISAGVQGFCVVWLHWVGWMAFLAWFIGAGGGFTFGVLWATFTKSNFTVGRYHYSYSVDQTVKDKEPS